MVKRLDKFIPPVSSHRVGLESSSRGSFFNDNDSKPIPWLWFCFVIGKDWGILVLNLLHYSHVNLQKNFR